MTTTSAGSPGVPVGRASRPGRLSADALTGDPAASPAEPAAEPEWGSGLAWLSRSAVRPPMAEVGDPDRVRPGAPGPVPAPGAVLTWLPEGRWATDEAEQPAADPVRPAVPDRRWGRRRLALARAGARVAGWPRRMLIGALVVAAVLAGLRPDPTGTAAAPPTAEVVVAARDLPAGTALAAADLRTVAMPVAVSPEGAARRVAGLIGRVAAGPLRRGEAVTDARVVGPGLTAGLGAGETAAVPVRIADPETAALVRAGDRVDVLGIPAGVDGERPAGTDEAVEVGTRLRVLAVLGGRDPNDGVVLVVAASEQTARRLAGAATGHRLTVSVRPP